MLDGLQNCTNGRGRISIPAQTLNFLWISMPIKSVCGFLLFFFWKSGFNYPCKLSSWNSHVFFSRLIHPLAEHQPEDGLRCSVPQFVVFHLHSACRVPSQPHKQALFRSVPPLPLVTIHLYISAFFLFRILPAVSQQIVIRLLHTSE